jgi:hypothetical protein
MAAARGLAKAQELAEKLNCAARQSKSRRGAGEEEEAASKRVDGVRCYLMAKYTAAHVFLCPALADTFIFCRVNRNNGRSGGLVFARRRVNGVNRAKGGWSKKVVKDCALVTDDSDGWALLQELAFFDGALPTSDKHERQRGHGRTHGMRVGDWRRVPANPLCCVPGNQITVDFRDLSLVKLFVFLRSTQSIMNR